MLGLLVLIGWYTNTEQLIQDLLIIVAMPFHSAFGYLLAVTGIGLAHRQKTVEMRHYMMRISSIIKPKSTFISTIKKY